MSLTSITIAVASPNATPSTSQIEYPPEIGRVWIFAFLAKGSLKISSVSSTMHPATALALFELLISIDGGLVLNMSGVEHPARIAMPATNKMRDLFTVTSPF